jgi:hypothetical protein
MRTLSLDELPEIDAPVFGFPQESELPQHRDLAECMLIWQQLN